MDDIERKIADRAADYFITLAALDPKAIFTLEQCDFLRATFYRWLSGLSSLSETRAIEQICIISNPDFIEKRSGDLDKVLDEIHSIAVEAFWGEASAGH